MSETAYVTIVCTLFGQIVIIAVVLLNGRRKANESHVTRLEKLQDREYTETRTERERLDKTFDELKLRIKELEDKLDALKALHGDCERKLSAAMTRLEVLEDFRNVVRADSPSGATRTAIPPPPPPMV